MTVNVYVEQHPNEDIRDFHLSKPVTVEPFSRYDTAKPVPKKVTKLAKKLTKLPQVGERSTSDIVGHKVLRIERNKAYSWDETVAAVHGVLKQFYGVDELPIEVQERNPEWDRPREERRSEWDY